MGVDPAVFSAGLARHSDAASSKSPEATPVQILLSGYNAVQSDVDIKLGSSTACVASVNLEDGELAVANLGDSGYLIVRTDGQVVAASQPQTYFFNAPYQLAKMPKSMRQPGSLENKPQDADVTRHALMPDQIVILATDGFFDNVFPKDAARTVAECARKKGTRQELVDTVAETLTEMARKAGRGRADGPFAEEAKAHRLRYEGGKEDDICLVVIALDAQMNVNSKL